MSPAPSTSRTRLGLRLGLRKALEPDREKPWTGRSCSPELPATSSWRQRSRSTHSGSSGWSPRVGHSSMSTQPRRRSCSVIARSLAGPSLRGVHLRILRPGRDRRLEELRLEAVELRVEADLHRGLSRELISELESLVRQHPLEERLTGQLMLACIDRRGRPRHCGPSRSSSHGSVRSSASTPRRGFAGSRSRSSPGTRRWRSDPPRPCAAR